MSQHKQFDNRDCLEPKNHAFWEDTPLMKSKPVWSSNVMDQLCQGTFPISSSQPIVPLDEFKMFS